jgi:hypothetical protein
MIRITAFKVQGSGRQCNSDCFFVEWLSHVEAVEVSQFDHVQSDLWELPQMSTTTDSLDSQLVTLGLPSRPAGFRYGHYVNWGSACRVCRDGR